jgi:hypothetical protein
MSLSSPFLTYRENHMKPETEVKTSLNILYEAVFSEGTDQLVVKQASEDSYLIVLRAKVAVKCISGKLVDQWIDGEVRDRVKKWPWPQPSIIL